MNVYLDYAATTPLDGAVLDLMTPVLKENFGNPDSLHAYGRRAAYEVTCARDRVANALGVQPNEVYFTSGGTEADNWAIRKLGSGTVCASAIEHHAVLAAQAFRGGTVAACGEDGIVTAEAVERALDDETGLVALMAVNNETGCVQPIPEVAEMLKRRGILLFSDCVQAACTQDLRVLAQTCDAIALSGHKIYAPKGVGALVVKKGTKLSPLIAGGEQERGLRGGTLNVAAIVGFSYALERAQREREAFCAHAARLRDTFEGALFAALGDGVRADGARRAPNISHLTFPGAGATLLTRLDLCGIAASGGAACSAHSALPSHVMLAMGRTEREARDGVRFSFGKDTTEAEVLYAANRIIKIVKENET
ncbi:MAG: cysteine desulfurase family protein [Candidatus Gallimonas sp.]